MINTFALDGLGTPELVIVVAVAVIVAIIFLLPRYIRYVHNILSSKK